MYLLYLLLVNKFIGPTDSAHSEEMNASIGGSCRGLFGLISNFSSKRRERGWTFATDQLYPTYDHSRQTWLKSRGWFVGLHLHFVLFTYNYTYIPRYLPTVYSRPRLPARPQLQSVGKDYAVTPSRIEVGDMYHSMTDRTTIELGRERSRSDHLVVTGR
jgi:hypothetical protein